MLSQFTKEGEHQTLADLPFVFPKDVYSVGRLDADSEGLLILTNDNRLKTKLLDPNERHSKIYWVQVEGTINESALQQFREGVVIKHNGKAYQTKPAKAQILEEIPMLWERNPPIRFRQNVPTSWLQLTITEGKNRQVRKMTASVGFPTLRLVRVGIEKLTLGKLHPNEVLEIKKDDFLMKFNM
jgi:23S rRNA pseudouridine2457 synthase